MNILIVGAGTIGAHIAEFLSADGHDIRLIDQDAERLTEVSEFLDVQTLRGSASDPAALEQAEVADSQLFLAMTNDDEANLIAAMTAKRMGASRTVARVRNPWFLDHVHVPYRGALDIDLIISPGRLTAHEIAKRIEQPEALALEEFARGRVQMRQVRLEPSSRYVGQPLRDLSLPSGVLIAAVARNEETIIPKGENTLLAGDRIALIGVPVALDELDLRWPGETSGIRNVVVFGGGMVGFYLAELLLARRYSVKVIELDRERCEWLTAHLPDDAIVIHGDASNLGLLKEERVGSAELLVACTGDDESNLMSCLLAKTLGLPKAFMVLRRPDYTRVVEEVGIDLALSPRIVTAQKILALVRRGKIRSVSLLEEGRVEILEFQALPGTPVVDRPLSEIRFPTGSLIGAVVHHRQVRVPHGTDVIHPGDVVVAFCLTSARDELEALFEGKD
jgi:trk system potassium uptake protein TrkA